MDKPQLAEAIEINGCYCCPNCGKPLLFTDHYIPNHASNFKFCIRCGQPLSWTGANSKWQTYKITEPFNADKLPPAKPLAAKKRTRKAQKPDYAIRLAKEYVSKLEVCDECFAEIYCTLEGRRESRVPCKNIEKCADTILAYLAEEYHE